MKTFWIALGVLAVLVVVSVVTGGVLVMKKGPRLMADAEKQAFDNYLSGPNHPPEKLLAVRRINNALKLHPSFISIGIAASAATVIRDDQPMTPQQSKMLADAAELLERPELSNADMQAFMAKYPEALQAKAGLGAAR